MTFNSTLTQWFFKLPIMQSNNQIPNYFTNNQLNPLECRTKKGGLFKDLQS